MIFTITTQSRRSICDRIMSAPEGWIVRISEETRTLEQNSLLWPLLTCFAEQLEWPVNGKMVKMSNDDWKDVLSAAFERETLRVTQGLDGGVVLLGRRTSKFTKPQFSEFIEFIYSVGAERGVRFEKAEEAMV